jgi:transposase
MRFYKNQHKYYCGIDLHAKTMYVCIVDGEGKVLRHKNIACRPEALLQLIAPYREDLAIAVECMFCWYWLADLCEKEKITFILGHALYMKAIHGGKAKNDKIDSEKIAMLLRGGMLPQAYVYPQEMRGTRDLMRRRLYLVQKRAELLAHVKMSYHQYNLPAPTSVLVYEKNRKELKLPFSDPSVVKMVEGDLALIAHHTEVITDIERHIRSLQFEKREVGMELCLLRTVPGIGDVLSVTILYEIEDIARFPRVQDFISYCRLVKPKKTSAGKVTGGGGGKIGNHHLKWAFCEAVMLYLRDDARGKALMDKLMKKHAKGKAMAIMAAKIARAVYAILERRQPFNEEKFFAMAA